jgi:hypothetical protein
MSALDTLLECYGVEDIRVEGAWVGHYHGDIVAHYLNTGDAYTETVLYDCENGVFLMTTYGDWLQDWESEHQHEEEKLEEV